MTQMLRMFYELRPVEVFVSSFRGHEVRTGLGRLAADPFHRSQHQPPNQSTEWPHKEPVDAKLPPAPVITADYPGLGRQDRVTGSVLF